MEKYQKSIVELLLVLSTVIFLVGCVSPPPPQRLPAPIGITVPSIKPSPPTLGGSNATTQPGKSTKSIPEHPKPVWVVSSWNELPGWSNESMPEVWNALVHGCERPATNFINICSQLRPLSIADENEQRLFLMTNLQPYKILNTAGEAAGLLTGYFEPVFNASRIKRTGFEVPVYAPTPEILNLKSAHTKWFTRQEIESSTVAQDALRGQEIAWMADPLDVLILQIQGSGRLNILEADGSQKMVKVIYAASNEQPYQSIGRYLLDHLEITDATWPGIKAWALRNPERIKTLLWVNPRFVFFKEVPLENIDLGPKGAQGLELTPGRSVAIDPLYIPYGTPLWMVSDGPTLQLRRWVMAQDTGNAINGPLRADYFVGTGSQAGEIAGHLRQSLSMWALLPR